MRIATLRGGRGLGHRLVRGYADPSTGRGIGVDRPGTIRKPIGLVTIGIMNKRGETLMNSGGCTQRRTARRQIAGAAAMAMVALLVAAFCAQGVVLANGGFCPPPGPDGCGQATGLPCKTSTGTAGVCTTVGTQD